MCWRDKTLRFKIELNLRHLGVSSMGFGLWLNLLHFINTRMYIGVDVCMCIKQKKHQTTLLFIQEMIKYKSRSVSH